MQIVITDSSGLIDLKKGGLFRAMLALPFEFVIPDLLFEDELLSLTDEEKQFLLYGGLKVQTLSGSQVAQAYRYRVEFTQLSLHDNFALVLAENTETCVLLTGDENLKKLARQKDVRAHGVLWLLDLILEHETAPPRVLIDAINKYIEDPFVWLPDVELHKRLDHYRNM